MTITEIKTVDTYPYLYGHKLMIPVHINGTEVGECEVDLSTLIDHFLSCVCLEEEEDEDEACVLLNALEDAAGKLVAALYD